VGERHGEERKLESSEEVGGERVKQRMKRKGKIIEGVEAESVVREDEGILRRAEALDARIDVRAPGPRAFLFFGDPA
jgi:hypothetical protein